MLIGIVFVGGCSTLGYQTQWESERSLCNKCTSSCPNWDFVHNYDGRGYTVDEYDNLTDVIEYR